MKNNLPKTKYFKCNKCGFELIKDIIQKKQESKFNKDVISHKCNYEEVTCPTCLGAGVVIREKRTKYSSEIRTRARELYRQGVSLRKIGKELNINHPQKVLSIIKSNNL